MSYVETYSQWVRELRAAASAKNDSKSRREARSQLKFMEQRGLLAPKGNTAKSDYKEPGEAFSVLHGAPCH